MEQYIIGNATIRISGKCDPDKLKAATEKFLKKAALKKRKNGGKQNA